MTLQELFPITLRERSLRFPSTQTDPARLVREELSRLHAGHEAATDKLLVSLALAQYQLGRVLDELAAGEIGTASEALAMMVEGLGETLAEQHVRLDDFTGRPWTPALRQDIEVRGSQAQDDLTEPRVVHMEHPVVYRGDRRIAKGAAIIATPNRGE